jgi:hypothetical protein
MVIRMKAMGGQSGSLNTDRETHSLRYDVWDDANRWPNILTLYAHVLANVPATYNSRGLESITWDEDDDTGHVTFVATYNSQRPPQAILTIAFDTTGGTVRARTSRATTAYPVAGRTAPDFRGAIEVSGGEPQGVEVSIPALKLVFSYRWAPNVVNLAAVRAIAQLTGTTNNNTWYGFERGELLFLGASGVIDLTLPTEVQYTFAASANATLSIGSQITGIVKRGHEHLWVAFEDTEDSSAQKLVQRPLAAYVERVYGESDFTLFGIGS